MTMTTIFDRKLLYLWLALLLCVTLLAYLISDYGAALNLLVAYLSSSAVLGASLYAYGAHIKRRLAQEGEVALDLERDLIDKIEDPHGLYEEQEHTSLKALKKAYKAQRRSTREALKESRATLSLLRLGAYLLTALGFFYLLKHHLLDLKVYLPALGLPIILLLVVLFRRLGH